MAFKRITEEGLHDAFFERVRVNTESGCWIWIGSRFDSGYGRIKIRGKSFRAHRISYRVEGDVLEWQDRHISARRDDPLQHCHDRRRRELKATGRVIRPVKYTQVVISATLDHLRRRL